MKKLRASSWCAIAVGMAAAIAGCAGKRVPLQMHPAFDQISTIALLPIVDARRDRGDSLDLEGDVRRPLEEMLRKKGYTVVSLSSFSDSTDVPGEELPELEPADIAKFGPPDARTLMVVSVNDVFSRYVVMAYTFKAEVEGMVIDKATGDVLWKDKGVVSGGQGGLVSGLVAVAANPVRGAVTNLVESVPDRTR